MATASGNGDIRDELKKLGNARKKLGRDEGRLAEDVTAALKRSRGQVPIAEAARLLGMHRTTVYRVYHPNG